MKGMLWLLAVACWVGSALLAEARIISDSFFFLLISALGWFFLTTAIGGKKGAIVGFNILLFAVIAGGFLWKLSAFANFLRHPQLLYKPEGFFFWFGVLAVAGLTLLIPSMVVVKWWKRVGGEKKAAEDKEKEKTSWRDFKVKY